MFFVFASSKNPDLSLKLIQKNPDTGITNNSDNFDKTINFALSRECPTWMYRANESEECICGVDNHHTVKCDQSVGRAYILDSYQMTFDEEHNEAVVGASLYGVGLFGESSKYDIYN